MENSLNDTQTAPDTQNPQPSAANPGASEASDFQSTATDEVLQQEAKDSVAVESTGQPVTDAAAVAKTDNTAYYWAMGAIVLVILGVIVLMKLIGKEESQPAKAPAAAPAAKKPATKKPAAQTAKKKPATKKRKSTKKKRK